MALVKGSMHHRRGDIGSTSDRLKSTAGKTPFENLSCSEIITPQQLADSCRASFSSPPPPPSLTVAVSVSAGFCYFPHRYLRTRATGKALSGESSKSASGCSSASLLWISRCLCNTSHTSATWKNGPRLPNHTQQTAHSTHKRAHGAMSHSERQAKPKWIHR